MHSLPGRSWNDTPVSLFADAEALQSLASLEIGELPLTYLVLDADGGRLLASRDCLLSGFTMAEVSADKAYLSGENLLTTLRHKAIPYIPFKSNSRAGQSTYGAKSTVWNRMIEFFTDHREEFLVHYHKRSNVETTFHMIKAKFGQRLRSKTMTAQINEALCKVLCHNLCVVIQSVHELGIETDFSLAEAA